MFINEAVNVNYEAARQLFVRTRGFIIIDYNPTHSFWLHKHIQWKDNCISVLSTYKDNQFLTPEQIEEIESNKGDARWWRVYGEGKVGELDGLVYEFEQIDRLPEGNYKECYGMDFGFTNDPTAIVHVLADTGKKELYLDEVCYKTRMLNEDIVNCLKDNKLNNIIEIYADCAEPKSIADIKRGGFKVIPCSKDAPVRSDKLRFQIQ